MSKLYLVVSFGLAKEKESVIAVSRSYSSVSELAEKLNDLRRYYIDLASQFNDNYCDLPHNEGLTTAVYYRARDAAFQEYKQANPPKPELMEAVRFYNEEAREYRVQEVEEI